MNDQHAVGCKGFNDVKGPKKSLNVRKHPLSLTTALRLEHPIQAKWP